MANLAVYHLMNGRKVTRDELASIQEKAKAMYLVERLSEQNIAMALKVTRTTVSRWKKRYEWDKLDKKAASIRERKLLEQMTSIGELTETNVNFVVDGLRELSISAQSEAVRLGAYRALGEWLKMFEANDTIPQELDRFEIKLDEESVQESDDESRPNSDVVPGKTSESDTVITVVENPSSA